MQFKSDGCSGGMSRLWPIVFGSSPPWEGCCITHDYAYWKGGTREDRRVADAALFDCVAKSSHPVWAWLMWAAVRVFGHPFFSFKWRWGFGSGAPGYSHA